MTFVNTASLFMDTSENIPPQPSEGRQFSETWPDVTVDDPANFRLGPVNTYCQASWQRVLSMSIHRASCMHGFGSGASFQTMAPLVSVEQLEFFVGFWLQARSVILKMSGFTPYSILAIFGPPSQRYPGFTPPDFFVNFGPTPFFQLLEALFWPKRRAKILIVHPTQNFGHFWALLKMSGFTPPEILVLDPFDLYQMSLT